MCGQFFGLAGDMWRPFLEGLIKDRDVVDEVIARTLPGVVRPTDAYPVLTAGPGVSVKHWGLVTAWSKPDQRASTFNARIESAADRPTFRDAFARRHALVPVGGFYEWSGPQHSRRKWAIRRQDGEPLVLAGLWEGDTFTILTRAAGPQMAALHDREPVVVGRRQWQAWLDHTLYDPALPPQDLYRFDPEGDGPVQASLF